MKAWKVRQLRQIQGARQAATRKAASTALAVIFASEGTVSRVPQTIQIPQAGRKMSSDGFERAISPHRRPKTAQRRVVWGDAGSCGAGDSPMPRTRSATTSDQAKRK